MAEKKTEVRVLKSLWGHFKMPYTVGSDAKIESKVAAEMIKGGFVISTTDAKKAEKLIDSKEDSKEDSE